jgi:hypothetical protein
MESMKRMLVLKPRARVPPSEATASLQLSQAQPEGASNQMLPTARKANCSTRAMRWNTMRSVYPCFGFQTYRAR